MCPCTGNYVCPACARETDNQRGGPQGSGADNAYAYDMRGEYNRGAVDALRAVMQAFGEGVSPSYVVAFAAEKMEVEL